MMSSIIDIIEYKYLWFIVYMYCLMHLYRYADNLIFVYLSISEDINIYVSSKRKIGYFSLILLSPFH